MIASNVAKQGAKMLIRQGLKQGVKQGVKKKGKKTITSRLLRKSKKMAIRSVQESAAASATDTKGAEGGGATEGGPQQEKKFDDYGDPRRRLGHRIKTAIKKEANATAGSRLKKAALAVGGAAGGGAGLMAARAVTKSKVSRALVKGMHQIPYALSASNKSHR